MTSRGVVIVVDSVAMKSAIGRGRIAGAADRILPSAMERLHNPSMIAYGCVEHVYSPREVGVITQKISDDEWMAIGSTPSCGAC
jgi:hypothetical protein